jgi:hypothetical protein
MCLALGDNREKRADLEDGEISESKINPTSASVVRGIVLGAQDEKDDKWNVIFLRSSGRLGERTVVTD